MLVYYLTMIYLTADKLFDIRLNLTYYLYWNEMKTKRLLKATWILSCLIVVLATLVCLCPVNCQFFGRCMEIFRVVNTVFDFCFLALAFFTYFFIFRKFKKSRLPPFYQKRLPVPTELSTFAVFKKSRFYIPLLVISSFIVFMVFPDIFLLLNTELACTKKRLCYIFFSLSDFVDASIYIYLQNDVWALLLKKCRVQQQQNRIAVIVRDVPMDKITQ